MGVAMRRKNYVMSKKKNSRPNCSAVKVIHNFFCPLTFDSSYATLAWAKRGKVIKNYSKSLDKGGKT